jgi:hypothetical protein
MNTAIHYPSRVLAEIADRKKRILQFLDRPGTSARLKFLNRHLLANRQASSPASSSSIPPKASASVRDPVTPKASAVSIAPSSAKLSPVPPASSWTPPSKLRPRLSRVEFDVLSEADKTAFFREGGLISAPGVTAAAQVPWTPPSVRGPKITRAQFDAMHNDDKNAFFRQGGRLL